MHTSTTMSPGKRLIWKRIGPLLLITLGVALLGGSGWLAVNWLVIGQGNMTIPTSLAGLPLSRQTTGQTALAEIERLHSKAFPMVDGVVAYYGDGRATLWVSSTWLPLMAARQVEVMTERIAEGRSPFTPSGIDEVEGVNVYALTGMGQRHYYFQLDRRVIWLAVPPQLASVSPGQATLELPVTIYDPTTDAGAIHVEQMHMLLDPLGLTQMQVTEIYIIANDGNRTVEEAVTLDDGQTAAIPVMGCFFQNSPHINKKLK